MDHRAPPRKIAVTTAGAGESSPGIHFPEEIMLNILSRLPIRVIVRFRCVCKQWRSLLSGNREFNELHHRHNPCPRHAYLLKSEELLSKPRPLHLLTMPFADPFTIPLFPGNPNPRTSVRPILALVANELNCSAVLVEPPEPRLTVLMSSVYNEFHLDLQVIGSIDGLFCLAFNRGTCVVLWNPATRDWYQTPDPHILSDGYWNTSFGFSSYGYGGYKVVRVVYKQSRFIHLSDFNNGVDRRVKSEVYDLRSNSWVEIVDPPQLDFSVERCGVIANRVPYWPADCSVYASESCDTIISFNPSLDVFRTLKRPDFGIDEDDCSWSLGEIKGSLVVLMQGSRRRVGRVVRVWIMVEDGLDGECWIKHFSIGPVDGVDRWLKCWEDGEFLVSGSYVCVDYCKELFLYDSKSKEIRMFPEFRPEEDSPCEVYVYAESLVSPRSLVDGARLMQSFARN